MGVPCSSFIIHATVFKFGSSLSGCNLPPYFEMVSYDNSACDNNRDNNLVLSRFLSWDDVFPPRAGPTQRLLYVPSFSFPV